MITHNHSNRWIISSSNVNQDLKISRSSNIYRYIIYDDRNMPKKVHKIQTTDQHIPCILTIIDGISMLSDDLDILGP